MIEKVIKQYKLRFENLKIENIDSLMEVVDSKITFEDPFNRIVGKDKLTKVFYLMFEKLKRPKFKVIEIFYKGNVAIIKWKFSCIMLKKEIKFNGLSEVTVKNGKVNKHKDFWDSGRNFYCNLPLLGKIFRLIHKG